MKRYFITSPIILLVLILMACSGAAVQQAAPLAIVAAAPDPIVGYGAATKGGDDGKTIEVRTADELRAAVTATGARIVIIKATGLITLTGDLDIKTPFITIDGSQAPLHQIKGGMITVRTHDVIFRHLRIRPGDAMSNPSDADPILLNGLQNEVYNVVIDHSSLSWGPDMGGLSILNNVHDVTVSNSILGPGLYLSRHEEGDLAHMGHSMSTSAFFLDSGAQKVAPYNYTFDHNLFTTADRRVPVLYGKGEMTNNVSYNWGRRGAGGNPSQLNFINNYAKAGPETKLNVAWSPQIHKDVMFDTFLPNSVYEAGTVVDGAGMVVRGVAMNDDKTVVNVYRAAGAPWPMTITNPEPAAAAYTRVLDQAGAQPRDSIDASIMQNVRDGTGHFLNAADLSWNTQAGPTPTVGAATPVPTLTTVPGVPTATPVPWTALVCSTGTIEIEKVDATNGRWRCVP